MKPLRKKICNAVLLCLLLIASFGPSTNALAEGGPNSGCVDENQAWVDCLNACNAIFQITNLIPPEASGNPDAYVLCLSLNCAPKLALLLACPFIEAAGCILLLNNVAVCEGGCNASFPDPDPFDTASREACKVLCRFSASGDTFTCLGS